VIELVVNGKRRRFRGPSFTRLLDVLREDFGLTGTKEGCGEGECGACTVLVEGEPVNSCLVPVMQVERARIETVEALGSVDRLSVLQQAFLNDGGAQCGICTPGFLMTAWAYLRQGGKADAESVRASLAGNLCRCTGYQQIVTSVVDAARDRRGKNRKTRRTKKK
jgi:carbon-monoxide dehydrogenase small subunit